MNLAAAYANALYNAFGIRFTELPITAEKIVSAIATKVGATRASKNIESHMEVMAVMQTAE